MTSSNQQRLDMVIYSLEQYDGDFDLEALKRKHSHFSIAVEPDGSVFVWVGMDRPIEHECADGGWSSVDVINEYVVDAKLDECIGAPGTVPGINLDNWRKCCFKIQ